MARIIDRLDYFARLHGYTDNTLRGLIGVSNGTINKSRTAGALLGKTATEIKNILTHEPDPDDGAVVTFADYFEGFARRKVAQRTRELYAGTAAKLRAFDPDYSRLTFDHITPAWLARLESWLLKNNAVNSVGIHLRNIRAAFNAAIDDDITTAYPFRRFKIRRQETAKRSLSVVQLRRLFGANVSPVERRYIDFFAVVFMLQGINVIDLSRLVTLSPNGRVEYNRAKTGRFYSVAVVPPLARLIEKYHGTTHLFNWFDDYRNYKDFAKNFNARLGAIAARLGLPPITSYWARHSWATTAAGLDIPKEIIAAGLGHGKTTTTDIYIKLDDKKVDDANARIVAAVFGGLSYYV